MDQIVCELVELKSVLWIDIIQICSYFILFDVSIITSIKVMEEEMKNLPVPAAAAGKLMAWHFAAVGTMQPESVAGPG